MSLAKSILQEGISRSSHNLPIPDGLCMPTGNEKYSPTPVPRGCSSGALKAAALALQCWAGKKDRSLGPEYGL